MIKGDNNPVYALGIWMMWAIEPRPSDLVDTNEKLFLDIMNYIRVNTNSNCMRSNRWLLLTINR